VTYGIAGPFNTGVELSGIPGQWFRASDSGTYLTQLVSGQSYGVIVSYAPMPSESRRLTYALGAGLDYYSVTVESYFDPTLEGSYPEDQPFRASHRKDTTFGLQLRGGLEYALVPDVSLRVSLIGRWARPIEVPGVALTHPRPDLQRSLVAHSVDLSSVQVSVGVGMRF
jgi:opacity protein-like surface antigen